MTTPLIVYRQRNPRFSDYYRCGQDHFDAFLQVYEDRFERQKEGMTTGKGVLGLYLKIPAAPGNTGTILFKCPAEIPKVYLVNTRRRLTYFVRKWS